MNLSVQYLGARLADGQVFDQSWSKGQPFSFVIGQKNVIEGWDAGLIGQKIGSRVELVIPAAQAYGDERPTRARPPGPWSSSSTSSTGSEPPVGPDQARGSRRGPVGRVGA